MATYDAQGVYRDAQGNVAPDPRSGDMAPGASQAISNFFGLPYTPGSRTPPAYMGAEEQQHFDSALPHDAAALATGRSGGGTFMPIQVGTTGAARPARGIQAGTLEEDIDQEAGGMGEVLSNIPGMYDNLDPMTADDNVAPTSPLASVTPPRKPTPPAKAAPTQSGPVATSTIDQRGLPGTGSGNTNTMPIPGANMKDVGIFDLEGLMDKLLGSYKNPEMAPSEAGTYSPMPEEVAGPNTVPPTGDDAGDLRGERRPMSEAEFMESLVESGNQQTVKPAPAIGSVRPTVPVNKAPLIGADSPMLKQLMSLLFNQRPPSQRQPASSIIDQR